MDSGKETYPSTWGALLAIKIIPQKILKRERVH